MVEGTQYKIIRRVEMKDSHTNLGETFGGFVIGTHSISPEIQLEYFEIYDRTCRTYGNYEKGTAQ
jgi:hypothetical protein